MPPITTPIRVMLVDSRPVVLQGLNALINAKKPRMEVIGNADRYAHALDIADRTHPDVVLLSFFPDALDPAEVIAGLSRHNGTNVLVLKSLYDNVPVAKAIAAGARGIVLTEDPAGSIIHAIVRVRDRTVGLDRAWTGGLSNMANHERPHIVADSEQEKLARLTPRERELIRTIASHPSDKYMTIAQRLGISEHTVHNHLSSVYHKLGLINRIDLLVYALKHNLVDGEDPPDSGWVEVN
jgi:NarL family two-component system response regulator LiaR